MGHTVEDICIWEMDESCAKQQGRINSKILQVGEVVQSIYDYVDTTDIISPHLQIQILHMRTEAEEHGRRFGAHRHANVEVPHCLRLQGEQVNKMLCLAF